MTNLDAAAAAAAIREGRTALGVELGSTRIKACLVDADNPRDGARVGSHEWENEFVGRSWTYSLEAVWAGVREAYAGLAADVQRQHGVALESVGAIGVSAMMHGYLAFDEAGELLVPFRTWRNTNTERSAAVLSELFGVNIPLRWSIAHLYQAVLDEEPHVAKVRFFTTLAGYVHWQLTGRKVLGVGDASGMFPIDPATCDYDAALLEKFDRLVTRARVRPANRGAAARSPRRGAGRRRTHRRRCCAARPERHAEVGRCAVPAGGRRRHRHGRDGVSRSPHGPRQRGHEHLRDGRAGAAAQRCAPRARRRDDSVRRPGRDGALQQRRERARRLGGTVPALRERHGRRPERRRDLPGALPRGAGRRPRRGRPARLQPPSLASRSWG